MRHFYIVYTDGPSVASCVMSADDLDDRKPIVSCLVRLRGIAKPNVVITVFEELSNEQAMLFKEVYGKKEEEKNES